MQIEIRHQISETEEEIYFFDINTTIYYRGIFLSNRNGEGDIFGYDWDSYYKDKKKEEIENLCKEFDVEDGSELYDHYYFSSDIEQRLFDIEKKYNPTYHKTIHGKPYLYGTFGGHKEYPLKISREEIIEEVVKKLHALEIK